MALPMPPVLAVRADGHAVTSALHPISCREFVLSDPLVESCPSIMRSGRFGRVSDVMHTNVPRTQALLGTTNTPHLGILGLCTRVCLKVPLAIPFRFYRMR